MHFPLILVRMPFATTSESPYNSSAGRSIKDMDFDWVQKMAKTIAINALFIYFAVLALLVRLLGGAVIKTGLTPASNICPRGYSMLSFDEFLIACKKFCSSTADDRKVLPSNLKNIVPS